MSAPVAKRQPLCKLSPAQLKTLRAVKELSREKGFAPTHEEMGTRLDVSPQAVAKALQILALKGLVEYLPRMARSLVITTRGHRSLRKSLEAGSV